MLYVSYSSVKLERREGREEETKNEWIGDAEALVYGNLGLWLSAGILLQSQLGWQAILTGLHCSPGPGDPGHPLSPVSEVG